MAKPGTKTYSKWVETMAQTGNSPAGTLNIVNYLIIPVKAWDTSTRSPGQKCCLRVSCVPNGFLGGAGSR